MYLDLRDFSGKSTIQVRMLTQRIIENREKVFVWDWLLKNKDIISQECAVCERVFYIDWQDKYI